MPRRTCGSGPVTRNARQIVGAPGFVGKPDVPVKLGNLRDTRVLLAVMGFLASPGHVAQHIFFALATVVLGLFSQSMTISEHLELSTSPSARFTCPVRPGYQLSGIVVRQA